MPKSFVLNFNESKENPCVVKGVLAETNPLGTPQIDFDFSGFLAYLKEKTDNEYEYTYSDNGGGHVMFNFSFGGVSE